MINLQNYIEEKLEITKKTESPMSDTLIKAVARARRDASSGGKEYYVYKTENSMYGHSENIDGNKIGDDVPGGTVVEIVKPR